MHSPFLLFLILLLLTCCHRVEENLDPGIPMPDCGLFLGHYDADFTGMSPSTLGFKMPIQYVFDQTNPVLEPFDLWLIAYPLHYPFGRFSALWIAPQSSKPKLCEEIREWKYIRPTTTIYSFIPVPIPISNHDRVGYILNVFPLVLGAPSFVANGQINQIVNQLTGQELKKFGDYSSNGVLTAVAWSPCTGETYANLATGLVRGELDNEELSCLLSGGCDLDNRLIYAQTGATESIANHTAINRFFEKCISGTLDSVDQIAVEKSVSSSAQCWRFADDKGNYDVILVDVFPPDLSAIQGECDRKQAWITRIYGNSDRQYVSLFQSGLISHIDNYRGGGVANVLSGLPQFGLDFINSSILSDEGIESVAPPAQSFDCQRSFAGNYTDDSLYGGSWSSNSCRQVDSLNTCNDLWYMERRIDGKTTKLPFAGRWYLAETPPE